MTSNKFNRMICATLLLTFSLTHVGLFAVRHGNRLPRIPLTRTEQLQDMVTRAGVFVKDNPKFIKSVVSSLPTLIMLGLGYRYRKEIKEKLSTFGSTVSSSILVWHDTGEAAHIFSRDVAKVLKGQTTEVPESFKNAAKASAAPEVQQLVENMTAAMTSGVSRSRPNTPAQGVQAQEPDKIALYIPLVVRTLNDYGMVLTETVAATVVKTIMEMPAAPQPDNGAGLSQQQANPFTPEKILAALAQNLDVVKASSSSAASAAVTSALSLPVVDKAVLNGQELVILPVDQLSGLIKAAVSRGYQEGNGIIKPQDRMFYSFFVALTKSVRANPFVFFVFLKALAVGTGHALWDDWYIQAVLIATCGAWVIKMLAYTPLDGAVNRLRARGRQRARVTEITGDEPEVFSSPRGPFNSITDEQG